nr:SymE family type I addiction module toxin [uncultured Moellerella sp.]
MAKAHSKSGSPVNKVTKTERFYTVGYAQQDGRQGPAPAIHLKGLWLQTAGFDIGNRLTVKVMDGCLVLIPDNYNAHVVDQQTQQHKKQLAEIRSNISELFSVAHETCK